MNKELSIVEQAEVRRQEGLDMTAVGKVYPTAKLSTFKGDKKVFSTPEVNTDNFKGIEFVAEHVSGMGKSEISARLWTLVKRPGRPAIKVYSEVLYGFSIGHLVSLANDLSAKKIISKLGNVFKIQEKPREVPQHILDRKNWTARL